MTHDYVMKLKLNKACDLKFVTNFISKIKTSSRPNAWS